MTNETEPTEEQGRVLQNLADGDRVRVGSWAQQAGTIMGWRGDICEWWVQLDDREKYPQWHSFFSGAIAPLAVVEQVFEKLSEECAEAERARATGAKS